MGAAESNIVTSYIILASDMGHRLFRNVRGMFWTLDKKHKVKAGLMAPGSADAIGYTRVTITQAMVGRVLPIFSSIEGKTATGSAQDNQLTWLQHLQSVNAIAGIATSDEDYRAIISGWLAEMG